MNLFVVFGTFGLLYLKGWKVVMVCQAASQTKFRALKHENGTAGCATIIVRVIACFQTLRECQVCESIIEDNWFFIFWFCNVSIVLIKFLFSNVLQAEYFRQLLKPVT